jgi:hypothetical protein
MTALQLMQNNNPTFYGGTTQSSQYVFLRSLLGGSRTERSGPAALDAERSKTDYLISYSLHDCPLQARAPSSFSRSPLGNHATCDSRLHSSIGITKLEDHESHACS